MDVDQMISTLKTNNFLTAELTTKLINKSREILAKEINVVEVSVPVTVCGDIHGQFPDLLELFKICGQVPFTQYLFLGDYVDRGYYSIECMCLLLCLKIKYPTQIHLLRGNHESRSMTHDYGFFDECYKKFGDANIYQAFVELFDFFPLAI